MAFTTVAVTPGAGAGITVDVVAGGNTQVVKLDAGVSGSSSPVTATGPLPVQHQLNATDLTEAQINAAANGNNTLVTAGGGSNKIRVWQFFLKINGSGTGVSLKFQDGAGGTDFHPLLPFNDKEGWVLAFSSRPWFTGSANTLLNLFLSAAIQVSGRIFYTVGP